MAEKRMFSKSILDSDAFLELSSSAQALYMHLCIHADDDGFTDNPAHIMRVAKSSPYDLKSLSDKGFVICFPSGVVVITHWHIHNSIAKRMYQPTQYTAEKAILKKNENGLYSLKSPANNAKILSKEVTPLWTRKTISTPKDTAEFQSLS